VSTRMASSGGWRNRSLERTLKAAFCKTLLLFGVGRIFLGPIHCKDQNRHISMKHAKPDTTKLYQSRQTALRGTWPLPVQASRPLGRAVHASQTTSRAIERSLL
jgi:hypothetical protein